MLHFGLGGVFGGPRREREPEPEPRFRLGEFWRSPAGTVYEVQAEYTHMAILRNIRTGRKVRRFPDALLSRNKPWELLTPAGRTP